MGSVWLGVHLSLGINVAIKFMAKNLPETSAYASFEREARAAAQLRNEHIVRIYDQGISQEGLPYLVMEYLAGESLAEWVAREGALPPDALASLVEQTASALAEAHQRAIVHRDVKPENILMLEEPDHAHGFVVKLIDFGLAKALRTQLAPPGTPGVSGSDTSPLQTTSADAGSLVAGTPEFMSPECLTSGVPPSPMLDLWGLAVTAFFAATGGTLPFEGDSLKQLHQRLSTEPLPMASKMSPHVPAGFDAWFSRACARDPDERFQSAGELAAALSAVCKEAGDVGGRAPGVAKTVRGLAPTEPEAAVVPRTVERRG
jgi:eukaryotic-like serine/threonine-protein kinase